MFVNDFSLWGVAFVALAPLFYYLGVILTKGLRAVPVLGPLGRIVGALCYLAAGTGGLILAAIAVLTALGVLMAGGSLLLVILVPLLCLALVMGIFLEPFITRYESNPPSNH